MRQLISLLLAASLAASVGLIGVFLLNGGDSPLGESGGLLGDTPAAAVAPLSLDRPTVENTAHLNSVGQEDRLIIPRFGVDAPLSYKKVGPDGQMVNPDGPDEVAYYDFSGFSGVGGAPGQGGNAVFAGHVDSATNACANGTIPPPCRAVLWDLNQLVVGDEIHVQVSGETFVYSVIANEPIDASSGPWVGIVAATAEETITIITCSGNFNRETRTYQDRQVVQAVRIG